MKRLLFASLLLLLNGVSECSARECPPLKTGDSEAFQYISAVVDSFGYLKLATTTLHKQSVQAQKPTSGGPGMFTDLMLGIKQASEDFECAATLVAPFKGSKDEAISTSAKATAVQYQMLMVLNGQMLDVLKQILENKISVGEMADKMSSNSVERDETFRALLKSVSLATFPLVVMPKSESENTSRLNITAAQKKELTTKLEKSFGPGIKKGFVAGLALADSPAYLIYEWLNKDWQLTPDK